MAISTFMSVFGSRAVACSRYRVQMKREKKKKSKSRSFKCVNVQPMSVEILRACNKRANILNRAFVPLGTSGTRLYTQKPTEVTPNNEQKDLKLLPQAAKAEAAKLAIQSVKDLGSIFSSSSEDSTQPIDTRPVFEDPTLFGTLSLLHQGQVLKELQEKFDKNWNKLTTKEKQMGYYIAYGNWGVREKFSNWNTSEAPLDLPFKLPSKIQSTNPLPTDKIHKLEPVILAETPVRKEEFDTSKMDPMTKTFIYITLFVALFAIARDKNTGEDGKPREVVIEDEYLKQKEERERRAAALEEHERQERASSGRKWYYLWLR